MPAIVVDDIRAKVSRAEQHLVDLYKIVSEIAKVHKVGVKEDPQFGNRIYYVRELPVIPPNVSVIAGEILHNIRSALDHIAYRLVFKDTKGYGVPLTKKGKPKDPFGHVYYPVFNSRAEYDIGKMGKIDGALQPSIDVIDATYPYKGGTDELWALHRLDIIDKHRAIVAVGAQVPRIIAITTNHEAGTRSTDVIRPHPIYLTKAGQELMVARTSDKKDMDFFFVFQVVINEPGIIEGKPIVETLKEMIDVVDGLITQFAPLL